MGFWHTGYIEHHEFSGMENYGECATRHVIRCDKCGKRFLTTEELQNHVFSEHKSRLPKLLIEGYEVHGEVNRIITKRLSTSDISLYNCKNIVINNDINISDPNELISILNTGNRRVVSISLISEDGVINNIK